MENSCSKCEKSAKSNCNNCKKVFYCSRECQKSDWKVHKANCRPFEISKDEKRGRFLSATTNISANTKFLTEPPSIVGPKWNKDDEDPSSNSFSCVGCFEPIQVLRYKCPNCYWPACSNDCFGLTNVELHDIECELLKMGQGPEHRNDLNSVREYYKNDALLALKILLLQRKNPKKFKSLMEMESNDKNRLSTYNFTEAEERICYLQKNFLKLLAKAEDASGQIILPQKDKKTLHKIFGIIETNAMYISLTTGNEICGLYLTGCLLEHSCLPNCRYNFDMKKGFKIVVETARDIKVGEHLTTTYSHVLWSTQLRQQHLKDAKYFTCTCERCCDPTELGTNFSTLRCLGGEDGPCNGFQLPSNPTLQESDWACNKCSITVSSEQVSFITGKMSEEIEGTMATAPTPKALEDLIEKLSQFLHPTHYHMFTLKHALLQLHGAQKESAVSNLNDEKLIARLSMCDELLNVTQTVDPYNIRIPIYSGVLLLENYNTLRELQKRKLNASEGDQARKCLETAQTILKNELDSAQGKQLNQKIQLALMQI